MASTHIQVITFIKVSYITKLEFLYIIPNSVWSSLANFSIAHSLSLQQLRHSIVHHITQGLYSQVFLPRSVGSGRGLLSASHCRSTVGLQKTVLADSCSALPPASCSPTQPSTTSPEAAAVLPLGWRTSPVVPRLESLRLPWITTLLRSSPWPWLPVAPISLGSPGVHF